VTLEDGTVKTDEEIPTRRLMSRLSDPDWKVRNRAAMVLGRRTEKGVPDSLLQVARTDKHLRVVWNALVSFANITGRMNRPIAARQEPINLELFIEMLNIEKLEQWWKEHSAEVNERLTPGESQ
jgi:HEAT repeat protein